MPDEALELGASAGRLALGLNVVGGRYVRAEPAEMGEGLAEDDERVIGRAPTPAERGATPVEPDDLLMVRGTLAVLRDAPIDERAGALAEAGGRDDDLAEACVIVRGLDPPTEEDAVGALPFEPGGAA